MENNQYMEGLGRPVDVSEPFPVSGERYDYADAFEVSRRAADKRSAEAWARDGFGRLPARSLRAGMLAHRHLLGFELGAPFSQKHIFGWHVNESRHDLLHLFAHGSRMDGHMIWRLLNDRLVMSTFVKYNRPVVAAWIWSFAGNIHRSSVPGLLKRAAALPRK